MEKYKDIKNFDELIELEHGQIGTESRNKYEEGAQMFIVSENQFYQERPVPRRAIAYINNRDASPYHTARTNATTK